MADLKSIERRLNKYVQRDVPAAHAAATKKALNLSKTQVVRAVAAAASVPIKDVRNRVYVPKRRSKDKHHSIYMYQRGVPLIRLRARAVGGGVQAGQYLVPNGFIATPTFSPVGNRKGRKSPGSKLIGRQHVFARSGRARYPIRIQEVNLRSHVPTHMMQQVRQVFAARFNQLLQHELKYRAGKS
jgi:hypothetical protein